MTLCAMLAFLAWLALAVTFLICLEKRKPWAVAMAESMAEAQGLKRPANRHNPKEDIATEKKHSTPHTHRLDIWTNWL